ncbi:transposable element Tc3 transposase [Trichonephila clavipes]|nr:transposable element Tc3 transposase [Trichonephila clavipes]
MRYDKAWNHTSSAGCIETFHSIFAVVLPLVRSNSWDAQLDIPNDPRYARLLKTLGIEQLKEGYPVYSKRKRVWVGVKSSTRNGHRDPKFPLARRIRMELWFQQDGATCHTARATIDLLEDTFGDRLISRFGLVNWAPRSWDLTPLDYFLWGYVKSWVYADKPQTHDHLEDNIRRVIADIRPQMLENVIENWTSRLDYIRASCGSPMPEIVFEM